MMNEIEDITEETVTLEIDTANVLSISEMIPFNGSVVPLFKMSMLVIEMEYTEVVDSRDK